MTDARTLLLELIAVIPNQFLPPVGMPTRYQGRTKIKDFYAHQGGRHRTSYPSSVRGTTCCGKGTNQAAAGIAERRRRGASAEPERGGRPPSATYRDLLRSVRLPQLERRSVRKLDHFDRLRGGDRS